ncbi:MAG: serine hydrolase, partial [Calditrichia bacterium]
MFKTQLPDPANLKPVSPLQNTTIQGSVYTWQEIVASDKPVQLTRILGDHAYSAAYAYSEISLSAPRKILFGFGSDDAMEVWLNGQLIHASYEPRMLKQNNDLIPLKLKKGKNSITLKILNFEADWGFAAQPVGPEVMPDLMQTAAARGNLDQLKLLLNNGAAVNIVNKTGLTAYQTALISGRKEAADFLASNGANVNRPLPETTELIRSMLRSRIKPDGPGAEVLVGRNGKILFNEAYGLGVISWDDSVTTQTRFRIGSITKQFTAAAILHLMEEGKLQLDDPLSKYIPDFPGGEKVTIHHLLTHISGIHSYTSQPDFVRRVSGDITTAELIDSIKTYPYDFEPGEGWAYNNSAYFILGYL